LRLQFSRTLFPERRSALLSRLVPPERRLLVLRCAAWFCVLLIAYLSLIPEDLEMRTPAPPGVEHAFAYGVTAGFLLLAYPVQPVWLIIGSLSAYSGLMELLQSFSPGRHPGLDGLLWSSAGAIFGGLLVALVRSRVR
jgi:VanZ family protein